MVKILVIDDDPKDRALIAEGLEERGYEAIVAENGRRGLMFCHRQQPDAVMLDLCMPEIDGGSVGQQLCTLYTAIPVVVFSACRTEEAEEAVLTSGATAFLQKAFSLEHSGLALQEAPPPPTTSDD